MTGAGTGVRLGFAVMELVRAYGVDTVWGIPGTHNLELYRPLTELGIRAITTRHEQGAGYAADAWAQRTGLPGVLITTSGPGLLNALSAAATAFCESRPLLILSPGPPRGAEYSDNGDLHETLDSIGAVRGVIGHSHRVVDGTDALRAVQDAFAQFAGPRPRPVHIEIPMDLLESDYDGPEQLRTVRAVAAPEPADADAIALAATRLASAARVVIVAGGGAVRCADEVRDLAATLQAPVLTSINAKGVLDETGQLALGSELRLASAKEFIEEAEVVLVIGTTLGAAELWDQRLSPRGTVIRVEVDPDRIHLNLHSDIALVGDARAVLPQLLRALPSMLVRASADLESVRELLRAEVQRIAPDVVERATDILAGLPADVIISGDSSQIVYLGVCSVWQAREPSTLLYMPTYATLGYGLPAAIGAKVADPHRPVVCVIGDGALMFSVQELATACELGLDLTVVCVDNGGYAEIRQNERDAGIAPIGVDLWQPDWAGLATAFGGSGVRVGAEESVTEAVRAAVAMDGVTLVHVVMPPRIPECDVSGGGAGGGAG